MMEKTVRRGTRTGFTTGACSAAAARAAVLGLLQGSVPDAVDCLLPNGDLVRFAVQDGRCDGGSSHAMVIKDAGDDPDCTDKAHLTADVRLLPGQAGAFVLQGGFGVGTVTMAGLGLAVGGPAINPVPRSNIEDNVRAVGEPLLAHAGLEVTISVPQGVEMAKKTLNARLGILGGISILGTTGIVKPYSTSAYRASVVQGVQVAATLGHGVVVLTTGGRTEQFAMKERPGLPAACFVQMGDFLRYALDEAVAQGLREVVIGGMVGKLTKIAQGETITHANRAEVDTQLLAELAAGVGAPPEVCAEIAAAETARFGAERMQALGLGPAFHSALAQAVVRTLTAPDRYGDRFHLTVLVCDFDGTKITEAVSGPAATA
ncbi:cobalt-precorrin-5B (C(1))-methyltransferase [Paracidovorax valerianellae]|uniref:Cobalt-precorrin-5B C(1)-methyltransferase n=1 Tax=Paracidovorax valerianellae TaxID=187868 RepID=A0A1G6R4X5_9BURK|nr:cobalt-precorrin-5B (C(1))-methyltransferase [Paracidovorax valerianellae]MDA8445111.1 cobalt-precorrin-5B (C(1))-methyltransferase [Paracidovorax valerianellae]SDC99608.1 cobalt-precorrin-5B (C1)-methyltransferase [Paracidovorax valerianellae]